MNKNNIEAERVKFEASRNPKTDLAYRGGRYRNPVVDQCWKTWQAALASAPKQAVAVVVSNEDIRMLRSVANYIQRDDSPKCAADLTDLAKRLEANQSVTATKQAMSDEQMRSIDVPEFRAALQEFGEAFAKNGMGYREKRDYLIAFANSFIEKALIKATSKAYKLGVRNGEIENQINEQPVNAQLIAALQKLLHQAKEGDGAQFGHISAEYIAEVCSEALTAAKEQGA